MNSEELKLLRRAIFKEFRPRISSKEARDAFMEFITRFTIIQDMREWSKLAEPGMAAHMIDEDGWTEQDIEDARDLDRNSVEMHSTIAEEFEKRGGKEAFQAAIDRLNGIGV